MTRLLAIETSAESCSVALHDGDSTREIFELAPMRHAELLLPAIRTLLDEAGFAMGRLDAIAFGRGPGSFTSLRIGIGVVQGLAWGAGLGVVPVSSLAAVAQEAGETASAKAGEIRVAMDARMQEVYAAGFEWDGDGVVRPAGRERVCSPAHTGFGGSSPFIAAGNGFERFDELVAVAAAAEESLPGIWPRAATVGRLALDWLVNHEPLPPAAAQPVYIRDNVADKQA